VQKSERLGRAGSTADTTQSTERGIKQRLGGTLFLITEAERASTFSTFRGAGLQVRRKALSNIDIRAELSIQAQRTEPQALRSATIPFFFLRITDTTEP